MEITEVKKLSDYDIQIRIARACGWKAIQSDGPPDHSLYGLKSNARPDDTLIPIPYYPRDLNAMHAAELKMSADERVLYFVSIGELMRLPDYWKEDWSFISLAAGAHPHVRAMAMVLVLEQRSSSAKQKTRGANLGSSKVVTPHCSGKEPMS